MVSEHGIKISVYTHDVLRYIFAEADIYGTKFEEKISKLYKSLKLGSSVFITTYNLVQKTIDDVTNENMR